MLPDQPSPAGGQEGWYPDPLGRKDTERYWDGTAWTHRVRKAGLVSETETSKRTGSQGGKAKHPAKVAEAKTPQEEVGKPRWSKRKRWMVFGGGTAGLLAGLTALGLIISRDVPDVIGMEVTKARAAIEAEDLHVDVEGPETGAVCDQEPTHGEGGAISGDTVTIFVGRACVQKAKEELAEAATTDDSEETTTEDSEETTTEEESEADSGEELGEPVALPASTLFELQRAQVALGLSERGIRCGKVYCDAWTTGSQCVGTAQSEREIVECTARAVGSVAHGRCVFRFIKPGVNFDLERCDRLERRASRRVLRLGADADTHEYGLSRQLQIERAFNQAVGSHLGGFFQASCQRQASTTWICFGSWSEGRGTWTAEFFDDEVLFSPNL